ncbi:glycerate kinase, partial [Georgenia thermotolerans]
MRVLLAPDRLSGALTAVAAARALARGWAEGAPDVDLAEAPMSDGAAGLLDVVAAARGGTLVPATVPGPLGEPVPAAVLHVPGAGGGTAYVEADQVLGRHLVAEPDRRAAATAGTSAGLGELLAAAVRTGAGRVVV